MQSDSAREKHDLARQIREQALVLGFDSVGLAPADTSTHVAAYQRWVESGFSGEMGYLSREDAIAKRGSPALVVPNARTAVVVAKSYFPGQDDADTGDPSRAVFARYARGSDYHDLLRERLIALQDWVNDHLVPVGGRAYVDTGPVLERELAQRAGLGWFGRNTMLIQPRRGSYHFLGVLLLDVEFQYDEPFQREHCGRCTRCEDACPTGALLGRDAAGAPRLDARLCISYLTIELKGPIPRELRSRIGNRIYGCDICQEVCPFNTSKFVQITSEEAFWPRQGVHGAKLVELMALSQEEFSARFKKSPVKRAKRRGLLRNVAVALGNWGSPEAVPSLVAALSDHEPLIRGHAAWALGRIGGADALGALSERLVVEEDSWVCEEIRLALEGSALRATSRGSGEVLR